MATITEVSDAPPTRDTKAKRERKPSGAVQAYLTVYNLTLGAAWAYVLYLTVTEYLATNGDVNKVYNRVELPLQIAQTAAVMEVQLFFSPFCRRVCSRRRAPRSSTFSLALCAPACSSPSSK